MPVADHDFDPDDDNIPPILRERIESWQDYPPSTQFQQYGPINRYLNLLFSIYELVCIAYIPAQVREARHTFIYRNLTLQHRVTRGTSTGLCCRVRPW